MIVPRKLQKNDEIRIVAPSRSLSLLSEDIVELAKQKLEQQGFNVSFSKNCSIKDSFDSSSISQRVEDLHEAFLDENVKAIFAVIGGFNSNQLLSHLDYDLIRNNPKIFCGLSDITALQNAITVKSNLMTYSGPNYSVWAMQKAFEYNLSYFLKCLMSKDVYEIKASKIWSDDAWFEDQENRNLMKNNGYIILNKGKAEGTIFGGNLCTFNLLQGTGYMPSLNESILFLEDDDIVGDLTAEEFDRNLQSIIHQTDFHKVKGLVIGRFQESSEITPEKLKLIIKSKVELDYIPIVANADFGHTNPMFTFPIGGRAHLNATHNVQLKILEH